MLDLAYLALSVLSFTVPIMLVAWLSAAEDRDLDHTETTR